MEIGNEKLWKINFFAFYFEFSATNFS